MKITEVTEANVAYVVQLGRELVEYGTFGISGPDFDWEYTLEQTKRVMIDTDYYLRMALDDDGKACGFVAGHVTPFFFSPKCFGVEDAWYVREGTRNRAKVAMRLMGGLVKWALDEKGATYLQSGDIASIDSSAVWALYSHMGFVRFGAIYKYSRGLG